MIDYLRTASFDRGLITAHDFPPHVLRSKWQDFYSHSLRARRIGLTTNQTQD